MADLRRYLPPVVLLVGCAVVLRATPPVEVPLAVPLRDAIGPAQGYRAIDHDIPADERRAAGMSDFVARTYLVDSTATAFTTLVLYYARQTQRRSIHSPRNCLPGAGWEIVETGRRSIAVDGTRYVVNRHVIRNGDRYAYAYYWYQGRGRVEASEYVVKWNLLRDAAGRGRSEEALARVLVPIDGDDPPGAHRSATARARARDLGDSVAARLLHELRLALPTGRG